MPAIDKSASGELSAAEADLTQLASACRALQHASQTLLLSSLSAEGTPELSYAPYVKDDQGCFYIFISELAGHTRNLLQQPACSVMFIRDESKSRNLFARERLTYVCRAEALPDAAPDRSAMLDKLQTTFGETVTLLRQLADFRLFRLTPEQGRYVVGFGRAYRVDPRSGELAHIGADDLR